MAGLTFKTINTADKDLQLIQDNIAKVVSQIAVTPFQNGNLLSSVSLVSGQDNLIAHKLGRTPQLVVPGAPNSSASIWSPASASLSNAASNDKFVNLRCSANCTVSIWVA